MSFEIIKSIVETEKKAETMKVLAQEEASKIIADAKAEEKIIFETSKKSALADRERLIRTAINESVGSVNEIKVSADEKCKEIRANALSKKDAAVDAVVRRVVSINGNG